MIQSSPWPVSRSSFVLGAPPGCSMLHAEQAVAVEDLARLRELDHALGVAVSVLELGVTAAIPGPVPGVDHRFDLCAFHRRRWRMPGLTDSGVDSMLVAV